MNGDSRELLREIDRCDTFYIDPARRSDVNKRLFALSDCEPDVLGIKDELLSKGERLIIKISPMADIRMTLELLPETTEIHILSVRNECKELLFVLDRIDGIRPEPSLSGIDFTNDGTEDRFQFTLSEEQNASVKYSSQPDKYIYEPNASILKAGGFKSIASRFDLKKLHINSHLYTSDELLTDFPGRAFRVEEVIDFSSKNIKKLSNRIPKANITVRNFPLTVEEIRKKTGIKDGGSVYLFATTVGKDEKMLLNCTKTNK